MSRTFKDSPRRRQQRRSGGRARRHNISVRAERRDPPDLRKLSRALIQLALVQAEAEAQDTSGSPDITTHAHDEAGDV